MSRRDDLDTLYCVLERLQQRLDGYRRLYECTAKSGWPERGVYFFFTDGELRNDGRTLRVVRVGTHAITATSKTTLWNRLSTHRGTLRGSGGNHRGSIFRKRVGEALLRTQTYSQEVQRTWGIGTSASRVVRDAEKTLEADASSYIGKMPFLWLDVPDVPSPSSERGVLERNCIALLSNVAKVPVDPPSPGWLGLHSGERAIRESGLWNTNHVDERYEPKSLELLSQRVARMIPSRA